MILGHHWPEVAYLAQKRIFFSNFTEMIFIYLFCPIMLQSFKKIPMNRSCDISLYNFVPESGQNCPLSKRWIFWKILLQWFLSTYCALSCHKIWKKSLEWIMGQKCQFDLITFRGKILLKWVLIVPYHASKFEKKILGWILRYNLYKFRP